MFCWVWLTWGDLTGVENVGFFGRLYGALDAEAEARSLLERFGLAEAMERPSKTYSRGMLQRLGLARALIGRPSLVLLDEPFTGLDRASTRTVIEQIHQLRDSGAMVLMSSRDITTTAKLADEVAVLVRGKLAHHHRGRSSDHELRERYASVTEGRLVEESSSP